MWWEFPPKSIQMLERFSCLVPASTTCRAVAVAKADQLSSDGHPAMQDELSATEDGTNVVFLHTTVDDGDHFQPRTLSGDTEVALATTEPAVARNYSKFPQREIDNGVTRRSRIRRFASV